jgi:hypothetical protein
MVDARTQVAKSPWQNGIFAAARIPSQEMMQNRHGFFEHQTVKRSVETSSISSAMPANKYRDRVRPIPFRTYP